MEQLNKMMKHFLGVVAVFAASAVTGCAGTLTIQPSNGTVNQGSNISIDVMVSGLVTGAAPALGAFQLDFGYDSALLSLLGVTFGNQLSLNAVPSIQGYIPGVGSAVTVFESSFNTTDELEGGQSGSFLLFRINFLALAPGSSPLILSNLVLGDANTIPNDITSSFSVVNSSVAVVGNSGTGDIPEPTAVTLVALAGAVLLAARRRNGNF
jgi:hypothetical protein